MENILRQENKLENLVIQSKKRKENEENMPEQLTYLEKHGMIFKRM